MDRFEPFLTLDEWSACRPFFAVPKGVGSRTAFEARMQAGGVEPLRKIEEVVQGKPAFVTSGIPGAVGCSVIDLWRDIPRHRRDIALWPFDGSLCALRRCREPVVAEIYPRAAYGLAIGTQPPSKRPRITVAKNRAEMRATFLSLLASPDRWVRRQGIQLCDLDEACRSGDAFDALVAAAALLRCVLERTPLSDPRYEDAVAEGGITRVGKRLPRPPRAVVSPRDVVSGSLLRRCAPGAWPSSSPARGSSSRSHSLVALDQSRNTVRLGDAL